MRECGSRVERLQPVLRSQFEDMCHSVSEHCLNMLAVLFEACLLVDEKIRQEKNVRAKSFTKLFLSNSLNDAHFLCIKQFEEIAQGFFKNLSISDAQLPTDTSESMKVVNYILKKVSVSEETNSSPNSSNITPLESKTSDANQIMMYKSYLQDRVASKNPEARHSVSKSFEAESGKAVQTNLFQFQSVGDTSGLLRTGMFLHDNEEDFKDFAKAQDQIQHDSDELHESENREPAPARKMYELFKKSTSAKRGQKSDDSSRSSSNESKDANNSMNDR